MLTIHAGFHDGRLMLWGEAPAMENGGGKKPAKRGRKKAGAAAPYPFDAGAGRISEALKDAGLGFSIEAGRFGEAVFFAPARGGAPVPSSRMIAEPPEGAEVPEIAPWTVAAAPLSAGEAIDFLCLCAGRDTLGPGTLVGRDAAWCAGAMRFAGELTARQRFLPNVIWDGERFLAAWEPVFLGEDAVRLTKLAAAMPHSVRAFSHGSEVPPQTPTTAVGGGFLRFILDGLVRSNGAATAGPAPKAFESVHAQWVHALGAPDGAMSGSMEDLAGFGWEAEKWRTPAARADRSPYRLCFRLEEPPPTGRRRKEEGEPPWRVSYLLQAANDPSLLVPAEQAWTGRLPKAGAKAAGGAAARECLLTGLGQAAGLCPRIEESLKEAGPSGHDLNSAGAHEFLTRTAGALEAAGFVTMLPAWWTRKGTKLRLTARASVKSPKMKGAGGGMGLDAALEFNWVLAMGGEEISIHELERLARLKEPLVRMRGQWTEVNAEEIAAAVAYWKKKQGGTITAREALQMALGRAEAPGGVEFEGVEASGWFADLLARLDGRTKFEELAPPSGFRGELRPYQARGYSWLAFLTRWGLGACLADDMGLGKTIQALALILREREKGEKRPVLLVCPTSVVGNWRKEAERFAPGLSVHVHHGVDRSKGKAFAGAAKKHAAIVSSYPLLQRDVETFKQIRWAGVVLDEAQNVKNAETKQSKAARSLEADWRIALTGTPVENNVGDLWAIEEFLNPGFLGTAAEFRRKFFLPIQTRRDPDAVARLKRLTTPFILRRLKTDKSILPDLPDKQEMKVYCTLTKEQATLYRAVTRDAEDALEAADGIQRKGVILATLMKLKQACNHPAQLLGDNSSIPGRSGKLARLMEMTEEALSAGDRALVFTQFYEMGEILRRSLQETYGREALFLHGGTPKKKRDEMVERFQEESGPPFFILSLKAGGTGLNLTRANRVFHFDRWWNPAVEDQATDRAHRIGQKRKVQVHKFLCAGTLEEKIDGLIERKRAVAGEIVGTGEGWLTELSTSELKELFSLRADAEE